VLHTSLCDRLGIAVPIIGAPLGIVGGAALPAAISEAGGLGLMSFDANPPELLRAAIARVRSLTKKPFGVNVLLPLAQAKQVEVCIAERVPVLSFFWGDPSPYVAAAHAAGITVVHQVGSVAEARAAAAAGVDVVIAQGWEAGGHVAGTVATSVLVPRVVDAIAPTPVAAAGGIADARGVAAVLALGAQAAVVGTRFLASAEACAHARYRELLLAASEEDTVHTTLFGGGWPHAPHRALRTPFVAEWLADEGRGSAERPDEPVIGETTFAGFRVPVQRFASTPPNADATGDIDAMALLMGQSAGLVDRVLPAAQIVRDLAAGAEAIIHGRLAGMVV
jgi:NAD(P)H-dependent flavin oxidoreductase YrpB (nitropropane dioxygenase family)